MKLGEWIKKYRTENGLSMQAFAERCGFSRAYVSILESGINPTTQKPVSPTIQTFKKISDATGQDFNELIKFLDREQLISVNTSIADEDVVKKSNLIEKYHPGINENDFISIIKKLPANKQQELEKITNSNFMIITDESEQSLIKKYRTLNESSKKTVDALLDNMIEITQPAIKNEVG